MEKKRLSVILVVLIFLIFVFGFIQRFRHSNILQIENDLKRLKYAFKGNEDEKIKSILNKFENNKYSQTWAPLEDVITEEPPAKDPGPSRLKPKPKLIPSNNPLALLALDSNPNTKYFLKESIQDSSNDSNKNKLKPSTKGKIIIIQTPNSFHIQYSNQSKCANQDYGLELLSRWKGSEEKGCWSSQRSKLFIYPIRQIRHSGDDYFLRLEKVLYTPWKISQNKMFSLSLFCSPQPNLLTGSFQPFTRDQNFLIFSNSNGNDLMVLNNDKRLDYRFAPQGQLTRFIQALQFFQTKQDQTDTHNQNDNPFLLLESNVNNKNDPNLYIDEEDHHTFIVDRDCNSPFNPFHCSPDMVNVFLQCSMFNIKFDKVRILFWDEAPESIMMPIWNYMGGLGVYTKSQWVSSQLRISNPKGYNHNSDYSILFSNVYFAIPPGSNFIWKDAWFHDVCNSRAPILEAFNKMASYVFLRNMTESLETNKETGEMNYLVNEELLAETRSRPLILFLSRRNARYRLVRNEDEIINGLIKFFNEDRGLNKVEIKALDLGSLGSFSEQIKIVNQASVLIGMHGAALTSMLYRYNVSGSLGVLEIFRESSDQPRMYENMALRLGARYSSWVNQESAANDEKSTYVNVHEISILAKNLLDAIRP